MINDVNYVGRSMDIHSQLRRAKPKKDRHILGEPVSSKVHHERLVSLIPVPYYWGWAILGCLFFLISSSALWLIERSFTYIEISFILAVLLAQEGMAVVWTHKRIKSFKRTLSLIVDLPEEAIVRSYEDQESVIFNEKRMMAFAAITLIVVHAIGIDYHELPFHSSAVSYLFNLNYYVDVYLLGTGLYVMIMTAFAVHKIGKLPLHVDIFFSDFQVIGVLYSKFAICAASVYSVWGLFHMLVPPRFSSFHVMAWFVGFAMLLVIYFILPQYSIHQMMMKTKKEKIEIFSSELRSALHDTFDDPTKETVSYLKDLLIVQHQLDKMCEWPFGAYELLHIALIIIIPLIVVTLEIVFDVIK